MIAFNLISMFMFSIGNFKFNFDSRNKFDRYVTSIAKHCIAFSNLSFSDYDESDSLAEELFRIASTASAIAPPN